MPLQLLWTYADLVRMGESDVTKHRALVQEAIFGGFDGLNTAIGLVCGSAHAPHRLILELGITVSLTSGLSMGAGTMVEADEKGVKEAGAMALATTAGTFLLIPPMLFLPVTAALVVVALLSLALCAVISVARGNRRHDWLVTYLFLAVVAIPTIIVAVIFGATG